MRAGFVFLASALGLSPFVSVYAATGACCLPGNQCIQTSATSCAQQCGVYRGDGTVCGALPCPLLSQCPQEQATDLAGHALGALPHFEFVDAFNEDEQVEITVDPTRFPSVQNKTCDLYVVADRSQAQWMADRSLTDVRGAPTTIQFTGADVQSNTRIVPGSDQLSPDAPPCHTVNGQTVCTGAGAGYDLVLDCSRNGTLGAGDFIDGLLDGPGFAVFHDLASAKLPTSCVEYMADFDPEEYPMALRWERVWVPDNFAALSSIPLVVISHGNGHEYWWYNYLQSHLASYGYVVMSHQNDTNTADSLATTSQSTLRHTDRFLDMLLDAEHCAERLANVYGCWGNTVDLCALGAKIDTSRIVFIGHSRGGNGVVWAYDRLRSNPGAAHHFDAEHFDASDVALVGSLAPIDTTTLDTGELAVPGPAPYSFVWTGGDSDVTGEPGPGREDTRAFQLFERATGPRQSVYLHGAAHGWFHEHCPYQPAEGVTRDCDVSGPLTLDREGAHSIVKAHLVATLAHYLGGVRAAAEYFWRPFQRFRPIGVPDDPSVAVTLEYRPPAETGSFVLDDYESNPAIGWSSSGGAVSQNFSPSGTPADTIFEGDLEDTDCHFDWERPPTGDRVGIVLPDCPEGIRLELCDWVCGRFGNCRWVCHCPDGFSRPSDENPACEPACAMVENQPMNGMTRSREGSRARGAVLEWPVAGGAAPFFYEVAVPSSEKNLWDNGGLSFRMAQMPRHPATLQEQGDVDFSIVLRDSRGVSSRLSVGAYGQGIGDPYQRTTLIEFPGGPSCYDSSGFCSPGGCDPAWSAPGWQAEFETVRIRAADFLANGSGIDLADIVAVRFEFGEGYGSPAGRVAIDDITFTAK